MDINEMSDPLEMCKIIISALILSYQPIRNFIIYSPEVHYTGLTLIFKFFTSAPIYKLLCNKNLSLTLPNEKKKKMTFPN